MDHQHQTSHPIIEQVDYWVVRVPLLAEWASSPEFGHQIGHDERLLLRLTDSNGYQGWGESIPAGQRDATEHTLSHLAAKLLTDLRPSFLDIEPESNMYWRSPLPPSDWAPNLANLQYRLRSPLQPFMEMAVSDLFARRASLPLYQFWGGAWRDKVLTDYWMGRTTPEHAKRCVQRAKELGFCGIKLKTSLEDPNVERLEAIMEAGGADFHVTVDPNSRFHRLDDALPIIRRMDRVGNMAILEDPFPRNCLDDFARLRPLIEARLALHVDQNIPIWNVLQAGAAGVLNIDATGGLFRLRMLAGMAEQANLAMWIGSNLDMGIGAAAAFHMAASIPNCQLPGDQMGPWLRESHLLTADFQVENGYVTVPQGAGLGVTVDMAAVDRYTTHHLSWRA